MKRREFIKVSGALLVLLAIPFAPAPAESTTLYRIRDCNYYDEDRVLGEWNRILSEKEIESILAQSGQGCYYTYIRDGVLIGGGSISTGHTKEN